MKKVFLLLVGISFLFGGGFAKSVKYPQLLQKGQSKMWCPVCGMNLKKFYKTSHSATTKDGKVRQYCSMRCLVVDMKEKNIDKNSIKVVNISSNKFIKAKNAFYVVGSKVRGTMSLTSKLAFGKKEDALKFIGKYGGKLMGFNEAFSLAKKELKKDIAFFNNKKKKMVYPKGKKIYKNCKKEISKNDFRQISDLKAYLLKTQVCGKLRGRKLQVLSLYIWEAKDKKSYKNSYIEVPKNEKCPVCGMFVYKYPKWATVIEFRHNNHIHKFYFDGVKDMIKFILKPNKYSKFQNLDIKNIFVTDYYKQYKIDGKKAYFVIGSDVYGPMGNELIPFKDLGDAKVFLNDHNGKKIVKFNEINKDIIEKLDK